MEGPRDLGWQGCRPSYCTSRRTEETSRCGDGGSRARSDAEEMQVAEVEAKVGGSGTFWMAQEEEEEERLREEEE